MQETCPSGRIETSSKEALMVFWVHLRPAACLVGQVENEDIKLGDWGLFWRCSHYFPDAPIMTSSLRLFIKLSHELQVNASNPSLQRWFSLHSDCFMMQAFMYLESTCKPGATSSGEENTVNGVELDTTPALHLWARCWFINATPVWDINYACSTSTANFSLQPFRSFPSVPLAAKRCRHAELKVVVKTPRCGDEKAGALKQITLLFNRAAFIFNL